MIDLSLTEIATAVSGRLVLGGSDTAETIVNGYVDTDSREITPGDIFVAKPGEVTDGHLYAPKAVQAGAVLCIVERELELSVSQIVVENSVVALGDLAREVITRVKALGKLTEIAVTGSNGKTTTKNLLREIFSARGETVAPIASFNNEVGAPITFCRVTENTDLSLIHI